MTAVLIEGGDREDWLTVSEVADYLHVSVKVVRRLIIEGLVPAFEYSGDQRVRLADVDKFMRAGGVS